MRGRPPQVAGPGRGASGPPAVSSFRRAVSGGGSRVFGIRVGGDRGGAEAGALPGRGSGRGSVHGSVHERLRGGPGGGDVRPRGRTSRPCVRTRRPPAASVHRAVRPPPGTCGPCTVALRDQRLETHRPPGPGEGDHAPQCHRGARRLARAPGRRRAGGPRGGAPPGCRRGRSTPGSRNPFRSPGAPVAVVPHDRPSRGPEHEICNRTCVRFASGPGPGRHPSGSAAEEGPVADGRAPAGQGTRVERTEAVRRGDLV